MMDFSRILNYILHSNVINFIIMLYILYAVIKKLNLGRNFDSSIESLKNGIIKSDEEKLKSEKVLQEAKELFNGLEQDVKELEKNAADKLNVFKNKIEENTKNEIHKIEENIERSIAIEEKKISNLMTEKASQTSIELAQKRIKELLNSNPDLHNQFIQSSLEELDKVKL